MNRAHCTSNQETERAKPTSALHIFQAQLSYNWIQHSRGDQAALRRAEGRVTVATYRQIYVTALLLICVTRSFYLFIFFPQSSRRVPCLRVCGHTSDGVTGERGCVSVDRPHP